MYIVARLLVSVLAILLAAYVVPGIEVEGFLAALIVAVILGVINVTLRPLLLLLTFPVNFLTFGLFTFVINALLLWMVASFVEGFEITSFVAALLGSLLISVVTWLGARLLQ